MEFWYFESIQPMSKVTSYIVSSLSLALRLNVVETKLTGTVGASFLNCIYSVDLGVAIYSVSKSPNM